MKFRHIFTALTALILMGQTFAFAANNNNMLEPYTLKKGEILFSQSKRQINAVNPTPYSNKQGGVFPGARGANQLVLYTRDYGERTHTNEFGTEAIIEGNTVTELSGADSFIPDDGAVISGHGTAKNWITSNISVGTKIYYDEMTGVITTFTTSDSLMFEAEHKIDEAKSMINYYKDKLNDYDVTSPEDYIKAAENYLKKAEKNPQDVQKYSQLAIKSANSALKSVIPFKNTEFKGVWLRPTETTESAIAASVRKIKNSGIDNVFIETYFHGRTIFPSKTMQKYGFISQNEKFKGIDPLKIWIREAHKNNIKVHIWFETFYVGNQTPGTNPQNILAVKPSWGNKTLPNYESAAATPSVSEHNGYFLDPANPEVQKFLEELINEIITSYKPDGINLDYIRYPHAISNSAANSWGYTEFARSEFYSKYGKDPVNLNTTDSLWQQWGNYRRQKINDFVAKIGKLGRQHNIYVSAVIFPDIKSAYSLKLQNWQSWSVHNSIDGFTPLFLTCNAKTLNSMVTEVLKHKAANTNLFAGLFVTFMGGSEEDLIREIHETRKLDISGVILFDFAHLDDKYINTLSTRVFSPKQQKAAPVPNGPVTTTELPKIDTRGDVYKNTVNPAEPALAPSKKRKGWFR